MDNLECPACHQKTIPVWRKMFLGPAASTACSNCAKRITAPYSGMWTVIPFLIALVASQFVGSLAVSIALIVVGNLVMC
jgi:ribosomal protein S27E